MPTAREDHDFKEALIPNSLLDDAIAWIAKNLNPEEVFDEKVLGEWATENGYISKEEE